MMKILFISLTLILIYCKPFYGFLLLPFFYLEYFFFIKYLLFFLKSKKDNKYSIIKIDNYDYFDKSLLNI
jgi:hypothetical protein